MLRIGITSVYVDDQAKALDFYTSVLGLEKRVDVPLGADRWLTIAPVGQHDVELLLEPSGHPAVAPYRAALTGDGIPLLMLYTDDIVAEHARLTAAGVVFTQPPTRMGEVTVAVLDDTCGNLVMLAQPA